MNDLKQDISFIYDTVEKLPQSKRREIILLMLAVLYGKLK